MTKAEQIKWLQGVECRLYYELDREFPVIDTKKAMKHKRVCALLEKMVNKYGI